MRWNRFKRLLLRWAGFTRVVLLFIPALILLVILVQVGQRLPTTLPDALAVEAWRSWSTVFTVLITATFTLTGALAGAALQSQRDVEKEKRAIQRERTKKYRDYLERAMVLAQRTDRVREFQNSGLVDDAAAVRISLAERDEMLKSSPPWGNLSEILDEECSKRVDDAIELALRYWRQTGSSRPSIADIQQAHRRALSALDHYEDAF